MKLVSAELAFPSPIFRFEAPNAEKMNAELEAEAYRLRDAEPGVSVSNKGGWHSSPGFIASPLPCVENLRNLIFGALRGIGKNGSELMTKADAKLTMTGWININPKGGYNAPHDHAGCQWSGCYYVKQPSVEEGSSGLIEFLDPRSDLGNFRGLASPWFKKQKAYRPKAGEMIIFPSYLLHWVHPNETDEDRISIAWNVAYGKNQ